jgi:hypothetical protein
MSYASAVKASFSFPAKYGWFLAGWAYLCTWTNVPPAGVLLQQCLEAFSSICSCPHALCLLHQIVIGLHSTSMQQQLRYSNQDAHQQSVPLRATLLLLLVFPCCGHYRS